MLNGKRAASKGTTPGDGIVSLRPVERGDVPAIVRLLHREFAPYLSESRIEVLFRHHWRTSPPDWGWWLEAGGAPVGFLGTLNSERASAGVSVRVSNLSSWYVQPAYRTSGLRLLMAAVGRRDHILTALSPSAAAEGIYRKLGFSVISTGFYVLTPLHALGGLLPRVRVVTSPRAIEPLLDEEERRLLQDHLPYHCSHYLLQAGGRTCYMIAKRRLRHARPQFGVSELLYVGAVDLLLSHLDPVVRAVLAHDRVVAVALDEKVLAGRRIGGIRRARRQFARLPPGTLAPRDTLYSEMVLFD